ncbi:MAG: ATP-binding protein [Polyangiaceae bacterium]
MTEAVCLAFLLVGSFFSFPWTHRTYIHYCFAFVANAAYFAIGLRAAVLVLIAGAIGAIIQGARARWTERGSYPETVGRVTSLVCAALASAFAMCVTHAVRTSLGMREYPLPFGRPGDVGRFMLSLLVLYVAFTSTKEGLLLLRRGALEKIDRSPAVETSRSLYALGGIVGAPMQFAAYAVYARDTLFAWSCVMLWSLLVNAVIAREVARMRHVGALMRELAAKERLAAIGEVTARIVHQTRHQLGLIGIIVHRIERRIAALPKDDAVVVRGELGKLGEVQDELRQMLARDLRGEARPDPVPSATYASLVRSVAERLEGLAASRGVRLAVRELTPAESSAPRDATNVAQAFFNVIENAIVAARHEVCIDATARGADLVVSIVDDGPGMTAAVAARAVEPFVTTKPDGTGMGLPIARAAVGEEGGVLRIGNLAEGGLSVAFVFPLGTPSRPIVT